MKTKYTAPAMCIAKFDEENIVALSVGTVKEQVLNGGGLTLDGKSGSDLTNILALVL